MDHENEHNPFIGNFVFCMALQNWDGKTLVFDDCLFNFKQVRTKLRIMMHLRRFIAGENSHDLRVFIV